MNSGKRFESKFRSWFKDKDCFIFKYPDYAGTGSTKKAICDYMIVSKKGIRFIELKHTNSKTSFALSLIKPHQWYFAHEIGKRCPDAFYFIVENGYNELYVLNGFAFYNCYVSDIKSVKFSEIEEMKLTKQQITDRFT